MCASSTPSSSRRSASHGPLRSRTRPVSTSVPVTTMPARSAHAHEAACAAARQRPRRAARREVVARPGRGRAGPSTRLPFDPEPHRRLAEVHPHALPAERLRLVDRALEDRPACPRRGRRTRRWAIGGRDPQRTARRRGARAGRACFFVLLVFAGGLRAPPSWRSSACPLSSLERPITTRTTSTATTPPAASSDPGAAAGRCGSCGARAPAPARGPSGCSSTSSRGS